MFGFDTFINFDEGRLNLNQLLVSHPSSTYFMRLAATHAFAAPYAKGDIAIVDRSQKVKSGDLAVISDDTSFRLVRVVLTEDGISAQRDDGYEVITKKKFYKERLFGKVTAIIHQLC